MVSLKTMRAALPGFAPNSHGFVAVFVGGTSGIGEAAAKGFAKWATGAKAYVIGRNAASAAKTLAACEALSPSSKFEFLQQDIVLLKDVDRVCAMIAERETKVDLLYLTTDIPTVSGRVETVEKIDRLMSLRYYARMRFVHNLMPLLSKASTPRVVSVFGPQKFERGLMLEDLGLKENYSNILSYSHSSLMNTFCMEEYASRCPTVSFAHVFPGLILTTNVLSGDLPWIVRKLIRWVLYPLLSFFAQSYEEAGDRMMFISLSASLPPRAKLSNSIGTMLPCGEGMEVLVGSDGALGSGNYCVNWKADRMNNSKNLEKLRAEDARQRIWEHTQEVFESLK
ncbi:hypothetical protein ACJ41O_006960 [Fusarium nematophilum]